MGLSLEVLLPHDITIITDDGPQYIECSPLPVPRTNEKSRTIGMLAIRTHSAQHAVPFQELQYGTTTNLPSYNPDCLKVVSKPTIAGALRERRPIDDLLYPYQPVRHPQTNAFLGVRGLARAIPGLRKHDFFLDVSAQWPSGAISLDAGSLQSTCPYPAKLLSPDTNVPEGHSVALEISRQPSGCAAEIIYDASLDEAASKQLALPIYNACPVGLKNDWSETTNAWRMCHIDTPPAALVPPPRHLILCDLVRDAGGYIVGGTGLARIAPHHFAEPLL